jgi:hypothetical protein
MPWSPKQHRFFCANKDKKPEYAKMCREGVSDEEMSARNENMKKRKRRGTKR